MGKLPIGPLKFEYRRGYKFSTYATCGSPGDHAEHRRPGADHQNPVHMIETINKLVRTSRQILHEIGREPTRRNSRSASRCRSRRSAGDEDAKERSPRNPIGDEEAQPPRDFIEDKNAVIRWMRRSSPTSRRR